MNPTRLLTFAIAPLLLFPASSLALEFPPTADRGAPARTAGGGMRGETCETNAMLPVMAVTPTNNVSTFVGETATLWVYVPGNANLKAELSVLEDATGEEIYTQAVTLPDSPGILPITLPAQTASGEPLLAVGKDYFWEFAVICDAQDRTQDQFVQGLLQRLEPSADLRAALAADASLMGQAELYAEAGIWQETLQIAARLRRTRPSLWNGLLSSVSLNSLAEMPLLSPSTLELSQTVE